MAPQIQEARVTATHDDSKHDTELKVMANESPVVFKVPTITIENPRRLVPVVESR